MSAIQPYLPPASVPSQPGGQIPARAARTDFFKAALDAVQSAGAEPVTRATAPASTAAAPATEERPMRPGALLDIRV